jgi:hypothetical protein
MLLCETANAPRKNNVIWFATVLTRTHNAPSRPRQKHTAACSSLCYALHMCMYCFFSCTFGCSGGCTRIYRNQTQGAWRMPAAARPLRTRSLSSL